MDRGAWQVTVYEVTKVLDMILQLNNSKQPFTLYLQLFTCIYIVLAMTSNLDSHKSTWERVVSGYMQIL